MNFRLILGYIRFRLDNLVSQIISTMISWLSNNVINGYYPRLPDEPIQRIVSCYSGPRDHTIEAKHYYRNLKATEGQLSERGLKAYLGIRPEEPLVLVIESSEHKIHVIEISSTGQWYLDNIPTNKPMAGFIDYCF